MPGERSTVVAVLLLIVAVIAGGILLISTRPIPVQITVNPPIPTPTSTPEPPPAPIVVYVTGAVNEPLKTIELPAGSRVQAAIDAAGGVTDSADLERVNLAGILRDGDQVHVPSLAVVTSTDGTPTGIIATSEAPIPTSMGGTVIYINTATQAELETLPGIGPATAQDIIAHREANGAFTDYESLDAVKGIGPATIDQLRGKISFE